MANTNILELEFYGHKVEFLETKKRLPNFILFIVLTSFFLTLTGIFTGLAYCLLDLPKNVSGWSLTVSIVFGLITIAILFGIFHEDEDSFIEYHVIKEGVYLKRTGDLFYIRLNNNSAVQVRKSDIINWEFLELIKSNENES